MSDSKGLFSGLIGSLISTAGSIYNNERNISVKKKIAESQKDMFDESLVHQQEMLERKFEFDKYLLNLEIESQKEIQELEREFRREQQLMQLLFNKDQQYREHEFQKEKQLQLFHLRQKEKQGSLPVLPGDWRNSICPNGTDPIVIFDTVLRQNHDYQKFKIEYNPLVALAQRFKFQNDELGGYATVIETHEGFLSEAQVRLFINQEFARNSVIVIYGDFLGNQFNVHCVINGIIGDQFSVYENGTVLITEKHPIYFSLGSISLRKLNEFLDTNNKEGIDPKILEFETLDLLLDFISNSTLQSLVDTYFSYYPEMPFKPKAGTIIRRKETQLVRQNLWDSDFENLINKISLLCEKIEEKRKIIADLRRQNLKEKYYKLT